MRIYGRHSVSLATTTGLQAHAQQRARGAIKSSCLLRLASSRPYHRRVSSIPVTVAAAADYIGFAGARAVVTGAASGIGRATAEVLLQRAAVVVACDVEADSLADLAARGAEVVAADLGTKHGRDVLTSHCPNSDHLVLAHGIVRPSAIAETTEDDWDAIVGVNAKSVYFLCKSFGPLLRVGASIVTLSSAGARNATSLEQSVYCASKAAVSSITRSFAHAYAQRGIRVNTVLPGIIDSPMQDRFVAAAASTRGVSEEELHAKRLEAVPLGRMASPRECAATIVWLLSADAAYITGQQIAVDGGMTMY